MDIPALLKLVNDGGVIGLLIVIVVGGARRWYVWNWVYREVVADRDYWRKMAIAGSHLAEKAVEAVKDA